MLTRFLNYVYSKRKSNEQGETATMPSKDLIRILFINSENGRVYVTPDGDIPLVYNTDRNRNYLNELQTENNFTKRYNLDISDKDGVGVLVFVVPPSAERMILNILSQNVARVVCKDISEIKSKSPLLQNALRNARVNPAPAPLAQTLNSSVDLLERALGELKKAAATVVESRPSTGSSNTRESYVPRSIIDFIRSDVLIQRSLECEDSWAEKNSDITSLELIVIQSSIDSRIKRVHDRLKSYCTEQERSANSDESLLLEFLVTTRNRVSPKKREISLIYPEGRYNSQTMVPVPKATVSGRIAEVLLPSCPDLNLKALVRVSS